MDHDSPLHAGLACVCPKGCIALRFLISALQPRITKRPVAYENRKKDSHSPFPKLISIFWSLKNQDRDRDFDYFGLLLNFMFIVQNTEHKATN